jgi:hypothetical protein
MKLTIYCCDKCGKRGEATAYGSPPTGWAEVLEYTDVSIKIRDQISMSLPRAGKLLCDGCYEPIRWLLNKGRDDGQTKEKALLKQGHAPQDAAQKRKAQTA